MAPVVSLGDGYWSRGAGGVWKRMRLTRKIHSSQLRRFGGISLSCSAGDGRDFVLLGRCMIAVERGGRFSLHPHEAFPTAGVG